MKDRRVDKGSKYSPIFGRYGFLEPGISGAGQRIAVGDAVETYRRNEERTKFGGWSRCKLFNANINRMARTWLTTKSCTLSFDAPSSFSIKARPVVFSVVFIFSILVNFKIVCSCGHIPSGSWLRPPPSP